MSWCDHIVYLRSLCGDCDQGCVIGRDGSIWTMSEDMVLPITQDEAAKLARYVNDGDESMVSCGLTIGATKFNFIRNDGKVIFMKKAGFGSLSIEWSEKVIVLAHCSEGGNTGSINLALKKTLENLETYNY